MKIHEYLRRSAAKDKTYILLFNIFIFVLVLAFYLYNRNVIKDVFAYVMALAIFLSGMSSAYSLIELFNRFVR